jgi:hypothetical protein
MFLVVVLPVTVSTIAEGKLVTAIDSTTLPLPVGFNNTETDVGTTCVTGVIEAGVTFKLVIGLKASEVTLIAVGKETVVK